MEVLRTPDERFEKLAGYPFAPHYSEIPDGQGGRLRIHHVEQGPAGGRWTRRHALLRRTAIGVIPQNVAGRTGPGRQSSLALRNSYLVGVLTRRALMQPRHWRIGFSRS